jgi:hypothetical protein
MTEAVFSHIKVMKQLGKKDVAMPAANYRRLKKTA